MKKISLISLGIILTVLYLKMCASIVQFPECYITTWKYQLYEDIKNGNEDSISYYKETYVEKGKILFDDISLD